MNMPQASVVIAANASLGEKLNRILSSAGYHVVAVCSSGSEVRRIVHEREIDLLITTYQLSDVPATDLLDSVTPITNSIMLVSESEKEWLNALGQNVVCLTYPIKRSNLLHMVDVLTQGGARTMPVGKVKEEKETDRTEIDKRVILLAKERLQKWHDMTEEEAHRRLQKWSMNSGKPMVEIAKIVLEET